MHLRHVRIAAAVALSVGLLSVRARAQQQSATSMTDVAQSVRAKVELAERAYSEGRYGDAAESFLAADRLQPTPAIQLALGKTYEQLNDPSHALASYREYFVRSPRATDRLQVQARVTVLAAQLAAKGVQQISVSSTPAGATVVVDAKPLGTTPIYVDLSPGSHHLEFHKPAYESASLDFELSPQQPLNVMTTLVPARPGAVAANRATVKPTPIAAATPAPAPAPPPTAPTPPQTASEAPAAATSSAEPLVPAQNAQDVQDRAELTTYMRTFGFGALGGSVVTLGAAVAFELMRSQSESRARQQRQQIPFKDALDTMQTQQTIARVFAVSAGVLAAAGAALLVLAAEREKAASEPEGAAVACAPESCSAVYRGHF